MPIGGPEFNPYIMLEVHYNNPENKSGKGANQDFSFSTA